jgi:hypothetical protein
VATMGPLVDSGSNPTGACDRVDGIIETCITVPIFRKYIRVPEGTRSNKQTNKLFWGILECVSSIQTLEDLKSMILNHDFKSNLA